MPIPASRGLEFDRVIIIDSSYVPPIQATAIATVDEQVQQLYVGLTRAKSHLVICYHRRNAVSDALELRRESQTAVPPVQGRSPP